MRSFRHHLTLVIWIVAEADPIKQMRFPHPIRESVFTSEVGVPVPRASCRIDAEGMGWPLKAGRRKDPKPHHMLLIEPSSSAGPGYIESAKNLFEIAGIAIGGLWTYLNYFRSRTYKSRLEPTLECTAQKSGSRCYLVINAQVKCVGLSRVPIDRRGTALAIHYDVPRSQSDVTEPLGPRWSRDLSAVDVFLNHQWIESGEVIKEQVMIELPQIYSRLYRIRFKINSGEYSWTTVATVNVEHEISQEGKNEQNRNV